MTIEFRAWPKTPRLFRDMTITEKIDGTNAAVIVAPFTGERGEEKFARVGRFIVGAQSRKRLIFPGDDNFGFAAWVWSNADELVSQLGEGTHYGEWWGQGIQRGYGLDHKRFSLFNIHRYDGIEEASNGLLSTVPVLYQGPYSEEAIRLELDVLREGGSAAAPLFTGEPEGVVVFHSASGQVFKVLLESDHMPKGALL